MRISGGSDSMALAVRFLFLGGDDEEGEEDDMPYTEIRVSTLGSTLRRE
jgi:hypothetical protein